MTEIPLKFRTHLPDEQSVFRSVELTATIDIFASSKCQEHLFSAEMEENMKKSIARYLENRLFSELRTAIWRARDELLCLKCINYQDMDNVVKVFAEIEKSIPKITPRTFSQNSSLSSNPNPPSTIEECHNFLLERLTNKELENIKNCHKSSLCQYHHTMGRWMRYHWGLWSGGKLKQHMESLGFTHPDDMSTVILESFWSSLNGQPYDLKQAAESYKEYWRTAQNNCKTFQITTND
jgi:hypothetical protein